MSSAIETSAARPGLSDEAILKQEGFNPGLLKAGYIAKKVLKWAAIGTLVGAVALTGLVGVSMLSAASGIPALAGGAMSLLGGIFKAAYSLAPLPWLAAPLAILGVGATGAAAGGAIWGGSSLLGMAGNFLGASTGVGLLAGGAVGLAGGVISAFSGANDYVEEERQAVLERYRSEQHRMERVEQVNYTRRMQELAYARQARDLGLNPNPGALPDMGRQENAMART